MRDAPAEEMKGNHSDLLQEAPRPRNWHLKGVSVGVYPFDWDLRAEANDVFAQAAVGPFLFTVTF